MNTAARNAGLQADELFIGLTRPPTRWGVPYTALLLNVVVVLETFVLSKQLLTLLWVLPLHGVSALLCAHEIRFFELAALWVKARLPSWLGTASIFRASSAGPLSCRRARRGRVEIVVLP